MEAAGAKRKRPLGLWQVDEVVAWLRGCDIFAGEALDALLAKVAENEIDGEVLSTVTEADLGAWLARPQRCAGPALAPGARSARRVLRVDSPRLFCAARRRRR